MEPHLNRACVGDFNSIDFYIAMTRLKDADQSLSDSSDTQKMSIGTEINHGLAILSIMSPLQVASVPTITSMSTAPPAPGGKERDGNTSTAKHRRLWRTELGPDHGRTLDTDVWRVSKCIED